MVLTAQARKALLTGHVSCSVGWLGSVVVFLVLAVAGLVGADPGQVRAAYMSLDLTVWYVIVPLSLAALITGVVQSLGTTWGLFRHYWVLMKLFLTVPATVVLLIHTRPVGFLAHEAAVVDLTGGDLVPARIQLIVAAGAAVLVLLVAIVLSLYKPRGLTRYGLRQQGLDRATVRPTGAPTPTHSDLRDDLRRRITAGEYTRGQPLPDLDTLSLEYAAEHSTVRRALHELAAEGLIVLNLQAVVAG